MTTVLLIIQLIIAAGIVGVVLMQRSEGGALGIGGGGPGGMMSGRGAATLLQRVTMILGVLFFLNCIIFAIVARTADGGPSVLDLAGETEEAPAAQPESDDPPAVPTDG